MELSANLSSRELNDGGLRLLNGTAHWSLPWTHWWGGSILAVPVLAYSFGLDEKMATAYSLFVVGSAALIGAIRQYKYGHVDLKTALVFGAPAVAGVWLVRHFVIPVLPDVLVSFGGIDFTRRMAMFGLFAILMLWAAYSMIFSRQNHRSSEAVTYHLGLILVEGLLVGGLTGFVGAGGGFLIIPALMIFANLEIKRAIGTSLSIIAFKSLLGFSLSDALTAEIDWPFLLRFTGIAVVGIFVGVGVGHFIDGQKLKLGFGYFIIVIAGFILTLEFIIQPN